MGNCLLVFRKPKEPKESEVPYSYCERDYNTFFECSPRDLTFNRVCDVIFNEFTYFINCCARNESVELVKDIVDEKKEKPILVQFLEFIPQKMMQSFCWMIWKCSSEKQTIATPNLIKDDYLQPLVLNSLEMTKKYASHGDIIVSGSEGMLSRVIEDRTISNLSHISLVIDENIGSENFNETADENLKIYQENGCGGRHFDYAFKKTYEKKRVWAFLLKLTNENRQKFIENTNCVMEYFKKTCNVTVCGVKTNGRFNAANLAKILYSLGKAKKIAKIKKNIDSKELRMVKRLLLEFPRSKSCSEFVACAYIAAKLVDESVHSPFSTPENLTWPKLFDCYYKIKTGEMLTGNEYSKHLKNFCTVKNEDYPKIVNSFCIDPNFYFKEKKEKEN